MREEILLQKSRTGTTFTFFNTDINDVNFNITTYPAVLYKDSYGKPTAIKTFDGNEIWKLNKDNYYEIETGSTKYSYITGRTFSNTSETQQSINQKQNIIDKFTNQMNNLFSGITTSYVLFEDKEIDDLYVNIKLERTFDVLNTLNVYNKAIGSVPLRNATTGVVIGKLQAVQKILDEDGNRVIIPLRNVPVGIFNSTDNFPDTTSTDNTGNRIRLNFSETSKPEYYFNNQSYKFDNVFLESGSTINTNVLNNEFRYTVYTNENGEFIINNVPTGPQVLFFEVDLLKQGLTKDEVALNYFPYPTEQNPIIDNVPHYFFRQLPIDVVPSWGEVQTGYTEVNVLANIDLRKWATYYIPPVAYKGNPMNDTGFYNIFKKSIPLTVQVRDMSRFDKSLAESSDVNDQFNCYPITNIQMVEIEDIRDKDANQQLAWINEFSQQKNKAQFYNYGWHALKLPANIYDPEGYKTDSGGTPMINSYSKGIWLGGYQLKVYLTKEDEFYRTTGFKQVSYPHPNPTGFFDRDHFHLCLPVDVDIYTLSQNPIEQATPTGYKKAQSGTMASKYPYEKMWSARYPEKYSIPKIPKSNNPDFDFHGQHYVETPMFLDGDLVGFIDRYAPNVSAGYGLVQQNNTNIYTDFATDVTIFADSSNYWTGQIYKYEPVGENQYYQCYANGYCSGITTVNLYGNNSDVINGEKFQRVEAGYGYFLNTSSLPRVFWHSWWTDVYSQYETALNLSIADAGYTDITKTPYEANTAYRLNHCHSFCIINNGKSIAMDLSKKGGDIVNDSLNLYRIINTITLPIITKQDLVPTYTVFNFGPFFVQRGGQKPKASGDGDYMLTTVHTQGLYQFAQPDWGDIYKYVDGYSSVEIFNLSSEPLILEGVIPNQIKGNGSQLYKLGISFNNLQIIAHGNAEFDESTNAFKKVNIAFKFKFFPTWLNSKDISKDGQYTSEETVAGTSFDASTDKSKINYLKTQTAKKIKLIDGSNGKDCDSVIVHGAIFRYPSGGGTHPKYWDTTQAVTVTNSSWNPPYQWVSMTSPC